MGISHERTATNLGNNRNRHFIGCVFHFENWRLAEIKLNFIVQIWRVFKNKQSFNERNRREIEKLKPGIFFSALNAKKIYAQIRQTPNARIPAMNTTLAHLVRTK